MTTGPFPSPIGPSSTFDLDHFGPWRQHVQLETPGFHDIEPQISLQYSSSGANGPVGVGWTIGGMPMIEARSATSGVPAPASRYFLEGLELVPCGQAKPTAASCAAGGTHFTKNETFQKVHQEGTHWTVWDPNGVKRTYELDTTTNSRWFLHTVEDTHANIVTYEVACSDDCYYDTISYAPDASGNSYYVVTFGWETRPDTRSVSVGSRIVQATKRLTAIRVTAGGSLVRAMQVTYDTRTDAPQSFVTRIEQFGNDATGWPRLSGSALPALTYEGVRADYTDAGYEKYEAQPLSAMPSAMFPSGEVEARGSLPSNLLSQPLAPSFVAASVTNDHRVDFATAVEATLALGDLDADGANELVLLDQTDGQSGTIRVSAHHLEQATASLGSIVVADVSGEGIPDFIRLLSNSNGTSTSVRAATGSSLIASSTASGQPADVLVGDFGSPGGGPDGRADYLWVAPRSRDALPSTGLSLFSRFSMGDGTWSARLWESATLSLRSTSFLVSDLNGDFTDDLVQLSVAGPNLQATILISDARGGWSNSTVILPVTDGCTPRLADVNGDHLPDMVCVGATASGVAITTALNRGGTFDASPVAQNVTLATSGAHWSANFLTADLNGDGLSDLIRVAPQPGHTADALRVTRILALGDGHWASDFVDVLVPPGVSDLAGRWVASDVNNDGLTDLLQMRGAMPRTNPPSIVTTYLINSGENFNWVRDVHDSFPSWTAAFRFDDLDADGWVDVWTADGVGNPVALRSRWQGPRITTQRNGLGVETGIKYRSSRGAHGRMPLGYSESVVGQIDTWVSPTGDHSQVSLSYRGFAFDFVEKGPAGFAEGDSVVTSLTAGFSAPSLHVKNMVSAACSGRRISEDRTFVRTQFAYDDNSASGNLPRTCTLRARTTTESDGSRERMSRTTFVYDPTFGTLESEIDEGEFQDANGDGADDLPGDNQWVIRMFSRNISPSQYIIDRPYDVVRIDAKGAELSHTRFRYDRDSAGNSLPLGAAPTKGDVTAREEFESRDKRFLTSQFTYTASGLLRRTTNPAGIWQEYDYDTTVSLLPVKDCNPATCVAQDWYYGLQKLAFRTDANLATTTFAHDVFGRAARVSFPDGGCITKEYLSWGDPKHQAVFEGVCSVAHQDNVRANGLGITSYFDGLSRVIRQERFGRYEKTASYLGTTSLLSGWERWRNIGGSPVLESADYDILGRVLTTTHPDGSTQSTVYWPGGREFTDENGNSKAEEFSVRGNPTAVTEWLFDSGWRPVVTTYEHDGLGRLVGVVDALGNASSRKVNSLGWEFGSCDPDRGCSSFEYYDDGRTRTLNDANGSSFAFTYDAAGRLTDKQVARGGAWISLASFVYDRDPRTNMPNGSSIGKLAYARDEAGEQSFWYDANGRRTTTERCTVANAGLICRQWEDRFDVANRLAARALPDASGRVSAASEVLTYEYDLAGRLKRLHSPTQVYVQQVKYSPVDAPEMILYGNGATETTVYDPVRPWLRGRSVANSNGKKLLSIKYGLDAAGRVLSQEWTDKQSHYANYDYDSLNRITQSDSDLAHEEWRYDDIGRIAWSSDHGTYEYFNSSPVHAPSRYGNVKPSYDSRGNMTAGPAGAMSWDEDDRLREVKGAAGSVEFGYSFDGERVSKTTAGGESLYFSDAIEESSIGQTILVSAWGRVIAQKTKGAVSWLHTDLVGSVRLQTDASGNQLTYQSYTPFGRELMGAQPLATFSFAGQRADAETQLVYMRARYYDPDLGMFVSPDSLIPDLLNPQSHNRFAYALNAPTFFSDRSGHQPVSETGERPTPCVPGTFCTQVSTKRDPPPALSAEFCRKNPGNQRCIAFAQFMGTLIHSGRSVRAYPDGPGPGKPFVYVDCPNCHGTGPKKGDWSRELNEREYAYLVLAADVGVTVIMGPGAMIRGGAGAAALSMGVLDYGGLVSYQVASATAIESLVVVGGVCVAEQGLFVAMASSPGEQTNEAVNGPIKEGAQDKMLTKKEIRDLEKAGEDVHELKGKKNASKRDLYKTANGDIVVKPKGGSGPGEPTGLNVKDFGGSQ